MAAGMRMADGGGYSASDAALTGFEIARREPLTVLVWSAVQAVVAAPVSWALAAAAEPYRAELKADSFGRDPAAALAALGRLAPLQLLSGLIFTALFAILYCGVYRTVLRPELGGPGRLRVGGDELRVAGVLLALFLLSFAIGFAALLGGGVAGALLGMAMPALRGFWAVAAFLCAAAILVLAVVRLSLAPPMTFATGRITVSGSWRLTRGRFWALFGTYLMAGLLAAVVQIAVLALLALLVILFGGGGPTLQTLFAGARSTEITLQAVVFRLVLALVSGFVVALLAGAPADAYRQLSGAAARAAPPSGPATGPSDLPRFGR